VSEEFREGEGRAPEWQGGEDDAPEELPRRFLVRLPQRPAYVVWGLLILTSSIYLLQMATTQGLLGTGLRSCPFFPSPDLPACYGLKVNQLIIMGQYWRLIAPILLHGSLLHIGFNMYALYVLGPGLERNFGHLPFLALYLAAGFAGFVVSFLLTPSASLGASTAIFGLLAAQGVLLYRNRHIYGERATLALRSLLNIAIINLLIGLSPGIDNWGHMGGVLGGVLFAWIAAPEYQVAGDGPKYELADQRRPGLAVLAFVITVVVFAGLAALAVLGLVAAS